MSKNYWFTLAAGCCALVLSSCAHRGDVKPVAETPAQDSAMADSGLIQHYIVRAGDCLWTIAAKPVVLGDPFRWPLLYKENRDEIEDPDMIQPQQDLAYHKHYDKTAIDEAVLRAKKRPPYHRVKKVKVKTPADIAPQD